MLLQGYSSCKTSCALTKPRLTYFGVRGLAEAIRVILAETSTDYEEVNVSSGSDTQPNTFKELASTGVLAFDQVPLYQEPSISGTVNLVQSSAIIRHLARTKGLYGKNCLEAAQCDMVAEGLQDISAKMGAYRNAPADQKEAEKKKLLEAFPKSFQFFENFLKVSSSGYFVGNDLTYCDLLVWYAVENFSDQGILDLEKYPLLKTFKSKIDSRPRINAYRNNPKRFPISKLFG